MDCFQFFTKFRKNNGIHIMTDNRNVQKTVGYLEKREKLKLINPWKKYWFVHEGQLLLYYGSKDEYDSLSSCKGSITLSATCHVKPYSSTPNAFQIQTRSKTVTLRAESVTERTKWMQAILTSLNHNRIKDEQSPTTKLNHFRYSSERVDLLMKHADTTIKEADSPKSADSTSSTLLDRLQKLGAKSYNDKAFESMPKLRETSPKNFKLPPKNDVVLNDDDFCACELNNNWELRTENKENTPKLTRQISLLSEFYSDNQPNKSLVDKMEELQCSMEFIEIPNEFECENEIYCAPHRREEIECENEIYCASDARKSFECENEIYSVPDKRNDFECENDIYCASDEIRKENPENNLYSVPTDDASSISDVENVYSVPFEREIVGKCDEKAKKSKKTDGLIQRLFRHGRKTSQKSDDGTEDTVDKTVAMLTDLQDILKRKKTFIKTMAEKQKSTSHSNESKIQTKDNPWIDSEEYCEVFDGLRNDEIYSEVTERRSTESKDLQTMLDDCFSKFKD